MIAAFIGFTLYLILISVYGYFKRPSSGKFFLACAFPAIVGVVYYFLVDPSIIERFKEDDPFRYTKNIVVILYGAIFCIVCIAWLGMILGSFFQMCKVLLGKLAHRTGVDELSADIVNKGKEKLDNFQNRVVSEAEHQVDSFTRSTVYVKARRWKSLFYIIPIAAVISIFIGLCVHNVYISRNRLDGGLLYYDHTLLSYSHFPQQGERGLLVFGVDGFEDSSVGIAIISLDNDKKHDLYTCYGVCGIVLNAGNYQIADIKKKKTKYEGSVKKVITTTLDIKRNFRIVPDKVTYLGVLKITTERTFSKKSEFSENISNTDAIIASLQFQINEKRSLLADLNNANADDASQQEAIAVVGQEIEVLKDQLEKAIYKKGSMQSALSGIEDKKYSEFSEVSYYWDFDLGTFDTFVQQNDNAQLGSDLREWYNADRMLFPEDILEMN